MFNSHRDLSGFLVSMAYPDSDRLWSDPVSVWFVTKPMGDLFIRFRDTISRKISRTLSRNPSQPPNVGFVTFLRSSSLLTLCPGKECGYIYVLKLVPTVLEMAITVILNDSSVALGHFRRERLIKALLGKVVQQGLDNGTEVIQYCTSKVHE